MCQNAMMKITKHLKRKKEDVKIVRNRLCSWINRINIIKMYIFLKVTYKFSMIQIKISTSYFSNRKHVRKFIWKHMRQWLAKGVIKNKQLEDSQF